MICPNCNRKYSAGTVVCSKCHVTLRQEKPPTEENEQIFVNENNEFEEVYQTWDSYDFLDAVKTLKDAGVEVAGDKWYSGELHIDGQGRGQAPYIWKIFVPVEQTESALTLLSGRTDANIGYVNASMGTLKRGERKIFWFIMAVVALIWAVILWELNF
jgi:hypothetical protein